MRWHRNQPATASRIKAPTLVASPLLPHRFSRVRYLAALLARLPTLASIQLTDYMGFVDPPSLLGAAAPQAAAKLAAGAAGGAAAAAAAKDAAGPSRAGTPGLLSGGAAPGGEGAAASSLAGWRREVAETPVPGGISQWDLSFARCAP